MNDLFESRDLLLLSMLMEGGAIRDSIVPSRRLQIVRLKMDYFDPHRLILGLRGMADMIESRVQAKQQIDWQDMFDSSIVGRIDDIHKKLRKQVFNARDEYLREQDTDK